MKRFYQLPRREQLALLVAAATLLCYALWFGIVQPLRDHGDRQQQHTRVAAETLLRIQALAGEIASLQQGPGKLEHNTVNLPQLVDRTLRENKLVMSGFQPGRDGDARLRLESADFEQLLQWLYQLEQVHRVRVGELSITPGRQPGQVSAQVQLLGESQ